MYRKINAREELSPTPPIAYGHSDHFASFTLTIVKMNWARSLNRDGCSMLNLFLCSHLTPERRLSGLFGYLIAGDGRKRYTTQVIGLPAGEDDLRPRCGSWKVAGRRRARIVWSGRIQVRFFRARPMLIQPIPAKMRSTPRTTPNTKRLETGHCARIMPPTSTVMTPESATHPKVFPPSFASPERCARNRTRSGQLRASVSGFRQPEWGSGTSAGQR